MSGIYKESQIQVELDGKWYLSEFDPEEDSIIIDIPPLEKPSADLKIAVSDNVGNRVIKRYIVK
jgi:hypothetical protein